MRTSSVEVGDLLIWSDPYGGMWPHLVLGEISNEESAVVGYETININAQASDEVLLEEVMSPTWAHVQCFCSQTKIV